MHNIIFRSVHNFIFLLTYNEDHLEYDMDEDPKIEKNQMYVAMKEFSSKPVAGYDVRYV